jgi:hypothetical protein
MTPPDQEIMAAWRAVANAKLIEFKAQCCRLAVLVRRGVLKKQDAIDGLWRMAVGHALTRSLGIDYIQAILDQCFIGTADHEAAGDGDASAVIGRRA